MTSKREDREALIEALKRSASKWDAYDFDPNYDYTEEATEIADVALAVFEQALGEATSTPTEWRDEPQVQEMFGALARIMLDDEIGSRARDLLANQIAARITPTGDEREALIEEAAYERYPDIEANPETFPTGWSRESERNAFIAGVMFERAHTPTDDEREALADWLRQGAPFDNETWGQYQDQLDFAASTIEAFRRPVQGEPTCEHGTPLTELCDHVERLVNTEPQGEPSIIPFYNQKMRELDAVRTQGEPTDAQVRAVWDALGPGITVAFEYEELRTALRAAAAVTEQGGENR